MTPTLHKAQINFAIKKNGSLHNTVSAHACRTSPVRVTFI